MRNAAKSTAQKHKTHRPGKAAASRALQRKSSGAGWEITVHRSKRLASLEKPSVKGVKSRAKQGQSMEFVQVRMDKTLLTQLNVEKSTELVGTVEDGALVIRPTRRISMVEANRLATKVMRKYDDALRKLAQ